MFKKNIFNQSKFFNPIFNNENLEFEVYFSVPIFYLIFKSEPKFTKKIA